MSNLIKEINYTVYYLLTKEKFGKDCVEIKDNYSKHLSKEINGNNVSIVFYDNFIVEHMIQDKENNNIYYIHLKFDSLKSALKDTEDLLEYANNIANNVKRALFCCTSGITSTLFANNMQSFTNDRNLDIQMDACDINSLLYKSDDYDVVVLTPQVHYKEKMLKKKINTKIIKVPTKDFASKNYRNVLSLLEKH